MRGLLAVAWREIAQRRILLVAAVVTSAIPWIVPPARGLTGIDASAARHITAGILTTFFAAVTALALGATMLAPAIASRRIAFDLAHPLSAFAIWAGRFLAAIALALAVGVIVYVPSGIGDTSSLPLDLPDPRWVVLLLGLIALVVLVALAHAAAVAILARSSRIAIDVVLIALVAGLLSAARRHLPLPLYTPSWTLYRAAFVLAGGFTLALIAAGYAAVSRGRSDIRAAHHALSITLWTPVLAIALATYGYARWIEAAGPRELAGFWRVQAAASGNWVVVSGPARGYPAAFLYDTASGRSIRLRADDAWPAFSADGRRAAWTKGEEMEPTTKGAFPIFTLDLTQPAAPVVRTHLLLNESPALILLSADGSRLATVESGVLSIHDVASSRTLLSVRVEDTESYPRGFFVSNELFRFYRTAWIAAGQFRLEILDIDVRSRALEITGSSPLLSSWFQLVSDSKGERLILVDNKSKETSLLDGRSGSHLATLALPLPNKNRSVGFLVDGRPAVTDDASDGKILRIFTRDGAPIKEWAFPGAAGLTLGGELAPGELIAAVGDGIARRIELVDVDTGERRRIAENLFPAARLSTYWNRPNDAPAVGSPATRLFYHGDEALVRLDPGTGKTKVLLGKAAR